MNQVCDYKKKIEQTGVIAFLPSGTSMWPTLKGKGQIVVVEKKEDELKKFDVALFVRGDGKYVLHRVVKVEKDCYIVRGDSQTYLEKVNKEQVLGVMTGFYKGKKLVSCTDNAYIKRVERWYKGGFFVNLKLKNFFFWQRVGNKLKKIFKTKK